MKDFVKIIQLSAKRIAEEKNIEIKRELCKQICYPVGNLLSMALDGAPDDKKLVIKKAASRNYGLTSEYNLEHFEADIYDTGVLYTLLGTRCKATIFVNNEGQITRKKGGQLLGNTSGKTRNYFDLASWERKYGH